MGGWQKSFFKAEEPVKPCWTVQPTTSALQEATPAKVTESSTFKQLLQADVITKDQAATVLHGEQTEHLIPGLQRWLMHCGPPQQLTRDEDGSLTIMVAWTRDLNIDHCISPAKAHQRIGLVEWKHQVLRKSVELYLEDQKVDGSDGIRQAPTYIVPQSNSQMTAAGYSPLQWVLGYQPQATSRTTRSWTMSALHPSCFAT